jgi:hypothetical protein
VSGVRNILWSPKILPELTTVCSPWPTIPIDNVT